jgi:hypothetical protein
VKERGGKRMKEEQKEKKNKNKRDGERRWKWQKFIRHKIVTRISY